MPTANCAAPGVRRTRCTSPITILSGACRCAPINALFEMLCLEGAQAGLSWITVLRKRETYRRAFDDFDAEKMARYNAAKRRRLLQDPGIIRNRLKVDAFIANAARLPRDSRRWRILQRLPLAIHGRQGRCAAGRCISAASPQSTPHSDAMSKDLKHKGFKFVGSTICYAFMQAVGIVNEHQRYCWAAGKSEQWPCVTLTGQPGRCARLALSATAAAPSFAQTPKPASKPLDVFDLQWAADPQISPDGRNIAYVRMGYDIKTDRPRGSIWLVGVDGKNERPLTGAATSGSPRWSPDGTRIAYLARAADGSAQLFMYWTAAASATAISNFTESPSSLAWSPDGRWLAFIMPVAA